MKHPRFSLRLLLLLVVLCAIILSWLKARDDLRKIDLQGQLAILESKQKGYAWRVERSENDLLAPLWMEDFDVREELEWTGWEVTRMHIKLGQAASK